VEFVDGFAEGAILRSTPDFDVAVLYEKQIDIPAERERLTRELARMEKEQGNAERQLGNEAFLGKAPAAVVEGLKKRAAELAVLIPKTREALNRLG
jgi:valyl-tRNA synthetase